MKLRTYRIVLILASLLIESGTALAQTPTFSLQAVAVNDVAITPSNSVTVKPGDTIVAEIFLSDWSPDGEQLINFQTAVPRTGFKSGTSGVVTPVGWDRPTTIADDIDCRFDLPPCPAEYPVCIVVFTTGFCVGTEYDPDLGVFIDSTRADWVFTDPSNGEPLPSFSAIGTMSASLRYGAVLVFSADALTYTFPPKYCGTLKLEVSDDASGIFGFEFYQIESELTDANFAPIEPLALFGLTIEIDPCGNGVIDAGEQCDGADLGACPGLCTADCTCGPEEIPTVSAWGLAVFALSLLVAGSVYSARRPSRRLIS